VSNLLTDERSHMTDMSNDPVIRAAKALMDMGVSVRAGEWDECLSAASIALAATDKASID
jgi:hypothetical protein